MSVVCPARTTAIIIINAEPFIEAENLGLCILIYIQQDATLHSLFYLETALHVSSCISTHHQERIQLHLQHLVFDTPLL
jgi:hypothetical protein